MISVLLQAGKVWPFGLAVIPFHSQSETRPDVKWRMLNICHSVGFCLKHLFISVPCIFFTFYWRDSSPFDPRWRHCRGGKNGAVRSTYNSRVPCGGWKCIRQPWGGLGCKSVWWSLHVSRSESHIDKEDNKKKTKKIKKRRAMRVESNVSESLEGKLLIQPSQCIRFKVQNIEHPRLHTPKQMFTSAIKNRQNTESLTLIQQAGKLY